MLPRHPPIVLALLIAGCDTGLHQAALGQVDAAPSPSCLEATRHSDFPWLRENVFKVSCANFSSCHQGSRPAGGLNLTVTRAYQQLVNAPATDSKPRVRVVPGDPEASYLLVKIGAFAGPLGDGGVVMPPNSPMLCAEKIDAVRRWIEAGAPEGALDGGIADGPIALPDAGADAPIDAATSD